MPKLTPFATAALLCAWISGIGSSCGTADQPTTSSKKPFAGAYGIPSNAWDERQSSEDPPLINIPWISKPAVHKQTHRLAVKVANLGDTTLSYPGYSSYTPQAFQEIFDGETWQAGNWDWCGTGLSTYQLEPGQSVWMLIHQPGGESSTRVSTWFSESNSERRSAIVLAEFESAQ